MYLYVHMYTYENTSIHTYIYIYIYVCVYIYIYIYMYTYTYIYIYICMCIHIYIYIFIRTCIIARGLHLGRQRSCRGLSYSLPSPCPVVYPLLQLSSHELLHVPTAFIYIVMGSCINSWTPKHPCSISLQSSTCLLIRCHSLACLVFGPCNPCLRKINETASSHKLVSEELL